MDGMIHAVKLANDAFGLRYNSQGVPDKVADVRFYIPQPFYPAPVIRPNIGALAKFHKRQRATATFGLRCRPLLYGRGSLVGSAFASRQVSP